jgi:leader peptidase (prepilin peptidase)/N-methyltransferase
LVLGLPASLTASCLGLTGFVMYGCMVCLWNRFKGKRDKEAFPVGPFLAGGAAAVYCMRLGGWMI